MKSASTSKALPADFPRNAAEWEAAIAAAPGKDRRSTEREKAAWADAVVVHVGGPAAVRDALHRKRGERGPGKRPAKVPTTLRLAPDVLARWKATGPGWQTRMAEVLSKAPR